MLLDLKKYGSVGLFKLLTWCRRVFSFFDPIFNMIYNPHNTFNEMAYDATIFGKFLSLANSIRDLGTLVNLRVKSKCVKIRIRKTRTLFTQFTHPKPAFEFIT